MERGTIKDRIEEGKAPVHSVGGTITPFFVQGEHWRDRFVHSYKNTTIVKVFVGKLSFADDLDDEEDIERDRVNIIFKKEKKNRSKNGFKGGGYFVCNDYINFFCTNDKRIKKTKNSKLYILEEDLKDTEVRIPYKKL
jgi:hypothetical protein